MDRIKKLALAALMAFALAAGGVAVGAGAEQVAGSKGCGPGGGANACYESSSLPATPEELQIASAPGCGKPPVASACRESS
jgi:hypothetical protein